MRRVFGQQAGILWKRLFLSHGEWREECSLLAISASITSSR
jgi:hypothetical protein